MSTVLVIGGARSGKSRFAETLAHGTRHYVATAEAHDDEMRARIAQHRQQRGLLWTTHEVPIALAKCLRSLEGKNCFVLVDCLTLWLSNLMLAELDWRKASDDLLAVLADCKSDVVLVSNEVGCGIVPDNLLARTFRDAQGTLNQRVAAAADQVVLMTAGLPLALKGLLPAAPASP